MLKVPAVTAAPEELYWPYQKGHCSAYETTFVLTFVGFVSHVELADILKSIPTCGGGFVHLLDGVPQPFKL